MWPAVATRRLELAPIRPPATARLATTGTHAPKRTPARTARVQDRIRLHVQRRISATSQASAIHPLACAPIPPRATVQLATTGTLALRRTPARAGRAQAPIP